MKITASAVSLNVEDVPASAAFLTDHFGFQEQMTADGFASLAREDAGLNVIFLRRGLPTLPADQRDDHVQGLILALTVEDLDGELARLQAEGVTITMPLTEEEWGERAFQAATPTALSSSSSTGPHRPPDAPSPIPCGTPSGDGRPTGHR